MKPSDFSNNQWTPLIKSSNDTPAHLIMIAIFILFIICILIAILLTPLHFFHILFIFIAIVNIWIQYSFILMQRKDENFRTQFVGQFLQIEHGELKNLLKKTLSEQSIQYVDLIQIGQYPIHKRYYRMYSGYFLLKKTGMHLLIMNYGIDDKNGKWHSALAYNHLDARSSKESEKIISLLDDLVDEIS